MAYKNHSKGAKSQKESLKYKLGLMLFGKKTVKKPQGTSIKMFENCPPSTVALCLSPKMPSFCHFFAIGNSFFALKKTSNQVFQNYNWSLLIISNSFLL